MKILQILIEEGVHALLNDAVVTCTMQSLTNPKQDHQEKQSDLSQAASKDCLSCRIWGGIVHLGIAGFVGSHVHQMPGRFSKAFIGLFSFGVGSLGFVRLFGINPSSTFKKSSVE